MSVLLALHFVLASAAFSVRRLGSRAFLVAGIAPLATFGWALVEGRHWVRSPRTETIEWVPDLALDIALRLDAFTFVMVVLISGTGALVFAYSWRYFSHSADLGGLVANLVGFAGAMLGLAVSDNLLALFVFWELTSVTSYLLIGHHHRDPTATAAARQALLITGFGGLAMLAGFVIVGQQAGSYSLAAVIDESPGGTAMAVAAVLVLLGAFTKSAQVPFHSWLPGAMAAPTPVSAYLHSATMVTAGVYLIARMSPVFSGAVLWRPTVIGVGVATLIVGAWRALRQFDLKLLLAYGTISQLGLMTALFGIGTADAVVAGVAVLVAQAVFKAALFMVTGIVDHEAGTRDLRHLEGLRRVMPLTFGVATVAAASMAGLPPMLGFAAKESVFEALTHGPLSTSDWATLVAIAAGSAVTVAYSARYLWGAFGGRGAAGDTHAPAWTFVAPPAVLAVLSLGAFHVDAFIVDGARALADVHPGTQVTLWHGVGPSLAVSALVIVAGAALFAGRAAVERLQARMPKVPDAGDVYRGVVHGIGIVADRITGVVQPGSLPLYLGVILLTALVVPGPALIAGMLQTNGSFIVGPPMQIAIVVIVIGAMLALVRTERRFAAVIFLGAIGYGVAGIFMVQGAPDLALTQILVETVTLVVFVLVLRHLPERFRAVPWSLGQPARVAVAVAVGLFVAGFALVAAAARQAAPVSDAHLERSYSEGGGRNVVNVILVDFRGFDTLGEIIVLTVATLGLIGMIRAIRRERVRTGLERGVRNPRWLYRPSPVLDVGVRALVHTLVVFSWFLLFGGHNRPGGGFIGGLVAGAALVLLHVRGGEVKFRGHGNITAERLLGVGVALAAGTGAASFFAGGDFLESGILTLDVPVLGEVKASSTLAFDSGVYLVVAGLVLGILRALGRERVRPV